MARELVESLTPDELRLLIRNHLHGGTPGPHKHDEHDDRRAWARLRLKTEGTLEADAAALLRAAKAETAFAARRGAALRRATLCRGALHPTTLCLPTTGPSSLRPQGR
jgi:hypothetical protein